MIAPPLPPTTYETSGGLRTGRYAEAVALSRALAARHPEKLRFFRYGTSPEGRPMTALLLSHEGAFDPATLLASKRPLVVIQNGIHSGEIEGKDATLPMLRDHLEKGLHSPTLERVNLLVIPVYSVDAHERFGPGNRVNQNGPVEMGWRATAQNLNLNRDWMKADAPETCAQIALLDRFRPDFLFDDHTTDGADYRYTLTLGVPWGPTLPPATADWQRKLYGRVAAACDRAGVLTAPYFNLNDSKRPEKGLSVQDYSPRFTNGYLSAINRPSMLVETHMLKPYAERVAATRRVLLETIRLIGQDAGLKRMNRMADVPPPAGAPVVLDTESDGTTEPFLFKGWRYAGAVSPITGAEIPRWIHTPVDTPTTVAWNHRPKLTVPRPLSYAYPRAWTEVTERLRAHGIRTELLPALPRGRFYARSEDVNAVTWRLADVKFPARSFEGRFGPTFRAVAETPKEIDLSDWVVVPVSDRKWRLVMSLMEPEAPDSFLRWGFFNAVTETKEYFEDYAMEPLARRMLADDPALNAEFERMKEDPKFVGRARLAWLYDRSIFADRVLNRYPVVRFDP